MSRSPLDSFQSHRPTFHGWGHATLAASVSLLATAGSAFADDPPLLLSNEHLGMAAAEIEATQPDAARESPPAATAQDGTSPNAATDPAWGSEFVSWEGTLPAGCADSAMAAPGGTIGSFEQCVEVSIRGGVGYKEAAHVCHALFPASG